MNIARLSIFIVGLTMTTLAFGQNVKDSKHSANIVSYGDVLQWVLALLLVLGLFAGLVFLLKKTGHYANAGKNQLSIVAGLSLGMREKLVLVNVGDKQLLLGVTPSRIEKLFELEGDARLYVSQRGEETSGGLFAQKLEKLLNGKASV